MLIYVHGDLPFKRFKFPPPCGSTLIEMLRNEMTDCHSDAAVSSHAVASFSDHAAQRHGRERKKKNPTPNHSGELCYNGNKSKMLEEMNNMHV